MRFWNDEVLNSVDNVVKQIEENVKIRIGMDIG